jgi:hypothetical protein
VFRTLLFVCATAAVTVASSGSDGPNRRDEVAVRRVLFIGNSLTSVNDVPLLVERLTADGDAPLTTTSITRNDYSLDDHWADRSAVRAIERGGWFAVVLQQGPSALPESRVLLRDATRRFDEVIRRAGARTVLYMVWPSRARFGDFDRVRDSYAAAAADVGALWAPAGDAWREAWRQQPDLALYGADGFHPTPTASYLSALVLAQVLTGRDATTLTARVDDRPGLRLSPDLAQSLREAASAAIKKARVIP